MIPNDDSFISDEEVEYCPLCVEEMDISDKNFKPCPCGYQICQFCYNNIRQNPELNGRCPACRRLYDDESVEYKLILAEEYRQQQLRKEKREREKKQKEREKKENEMANKKHLAGLRVVQKNLVYVTGLNPPCSPDELHQVLRSDRYFGQYGKILKIVINKKTPVGGGSNLVSHHSNAGLVVYVTFSRKEDALKCIQELDGSLCDGRLLRAAHGTTKYCLSYLRGHPCPNPNCMFLHEPGEEADLYTRKDLLTQQGLKMSMMGMNKESKSGSSNGIGSNGGANLEYDDESAPSEDDSQPESTPVVSNVATAATAAASTSSTPHPVLPPTAHWAAAPVLLATPSPAVNNNAKLANAAAFPALGETLKDKILHSTVAKDLKKIKSTRNKDQTEPEGIDQDDLLVIHFIEDTAQHLKAISERKQKLAVHFKALEDALEKELPFFAFNRSNSLANNTNLEEEKLIACQSIERFLLRSVKNYHLAYQNHPILQQQVLLQQQAQIQQQAQLQQAQVHALAQAQGQGGQGETPLQQPSQMHQLQMQQQHQQQQQQKLLQDIKNGHGNGNGTSDEQIQQQNLLLQQLHYQQQQYQQSHEAPLAPVNILKNERSRTSTPPPPGLFTSKQGAPLQPAPAANNQSLSSQLLIQLMNGKK